MEDTDTVAGTKAEAEAYYRINSSINSVVWTRFSQSPDERGLWVNASASLRRTTYPKVRPNCSVAATRFNSRYVREIPEAFFRVQMQCSCGKKDTTVKVESKLQMSGRSALLYLTLAKGTELREHQPTCGASWET